MPSSATPRKQAQPLPHRPLVGIVCDRFFVGEHDTHTAKESYRRALHDVSHVAPVLIPVTEDLNDIAPYLDALSGLLFPGGASNVAPDQYGRGVAASFLLDRARDHVALELIRQATQRNMPMLAICRGFQEMNVAFGGTLHSDIYQSGHSDEHREDLSEDLVTRYRYKHAVTLEQGGLLNRWLGNGTARVNSLHTQGIETLGAGLSAEAHAADGLVEAIRHVGQDFAVGVQWHPEVTVESDALSRALFEKFGEACANYAASRT